jgi:hypothetical protein
MVVLFVRSSVRLAEVEEPAVPPVFRLQLGQLRVDQKIDL